MQIYLIKPRKFFTNKKLCTATSQVNLFLFILLFILLSGCSTTAHRDFEIKNLSIVSNDFQVEVSEYSAAQPSEKSLIIMPPTGGENAIDRSYARRFSKLGYDVFIIKHWTGLEEKSTDLELHQRVYTKAQKAIGLVLEKIKSPYIGMLGTSLGALHASIAASLHDRLDAVFIIAGGAPITEVIVTSDQQAMIDLKEARKLRYGFKTDADNKIALDQAFKLEPTKLGEKYKSKDLGMVIAMDDTTVPTADQLNLRDYWKPKKSIYLKSSHFWAIVKAWLFEEDSIEEFFQESVLRSKSHSFSN